MIINVWQGKNCYYSKNFFVGLFCMDSCTHYCWTFWIYGCLIKSANASFKRIRCVRNRYEVMNNRFYQNENSKRELEGSPTNSIFLPSEHKKCTQSLYQNAMEWDGHSKGSDWILFVLSFAAFKKTSAFTDVSLERIKQNLYFYK